MRKVLWICNIMLPVIAREFSLSYSNTIFTKIVRIGQCCIHIILFDGCALRYICIKFSEV